MEVKAGITDGAFSELVGGELKEGDEVIIGVDMQKGPHGSSLPPGFGSHPRR